MGYKVVDADLAMNDDAVIAEMTIQKTEGKPEDCKPLTVVLAEVEGYPQLMTVEDPLPKKVKKDPDELSEFLNSHESLIESYDDIFGLQDTEQYDAYRYLLYLLFCEPGEEKTFIKETKGKKLEEIEIPETDIEADYRQAVEDGLYES